MFLCFLFSFEEILDREADTHWGNYTFINLFSVSVRLFVKLSLHPSFSSHSPWFTSQCWSRRRFSYYETSSWTALTSIKILFSVFICITNVLFYGTQAWSRCIEFWFSYAYVSAGATRLHFRCCARISSSKWIDCSRSLKHEFQWSIL